MQASQKDNAVEFSRAKSFSDPINLTSLETFPISNASVYRILDNVPYLSLQVVQCQDDENVEDLCYFKHSLYIVA